MGSRGSSPGTSSRGRVAVATCDLPRLRGLLGLLLLGLRDQLLGELALALRVELLHLVLDGPPVVGLVPVVEGLEAEQNRLADELAQHLVGRPHHPAGLAVAQVALELHVALVAGAAAGVQHLVDHVGDVLGRFELDLPGPVQEVGPLSVDASEIVYSTSPRPGKRYDKKCEQAYTKGRRYYY